MQNEAASAGHTRVGRRAVWWIDARHAGHPRAAAARLAPFAHQVVRATVPILRLPLPGKNADLQQAATTIGCFDTSSVATAPAGTFIVVTAFPAQVIAAAISICMALTMFVLATLRTCAAALSTTVCAIANSVIVSATIEASPTKEATVPVGHAENGNAGIVFPAATGAIRWPTGNNRFATRAIGLAADIALPPLLALFSLLLVTGLNGGIEHSYDASGQCKQAGHCRAARLHQSSDKGIELAVIHGTTLRD